MSIRPFRDISRHPTRQIQVGPVGRVSVAGPAPGNTGPPEIAQCCADCFSAAVPQGWNPGQNGVVFFEVTLPPL